MCVFVFVLISFNFYFIELCPNKMSYTKLFSPGVPPGRAAWILLLWWADYVRGLVGLVGPLSGWLPDPALYSCCCLLFSGTWSQGSWLWNPKEPHRVSVGSLVGRVRVPKTLGLLPTDWQVKPDAGFGARLLSGRAGSWSQTAGPGIPELFQIIEIGRAHV